MNGMHTMMRANEMLETRLALELWRHHTEQKTQILLVSETLYQLKIYTNTVTGFSQSALHDQSVTHKPLTRRTNQVVLS